MITPGDYLYRARPGVYRLEYENETRQHKSCGRKHRFRTRRKAVQQKDRLALNIGQSASVYRCEHCGGWHLRRDSVTDCDKGE